MQESNFLKKSQVNGNGATLIVLLLLGLIIAFSLFISPTERNQLLNITTNTTTSTTTPGSITPSGIILLSTTPGQLYAQPDKTETIPIPDISLGSQTSGKELLNVPQIVASHSLFSSNAQSLSFTLGDLSADQGGYLSFNVAESSGTLSIYFNNQLIYSGMINSGSTTTPIKLNNIQSSNTLKFVVSSPGIRFWATNSYTLTNIVVAANAETKSSLYSKTNIYLTSDQLSNIHQMYFQFETDCSQSTVGSVSIKINSNNITSGAPVCSNLNMVPINPSYLNSGTNDISFSTDHGFITFQRMNIIINHGAIKEPVYYFHFTQSQINNIKSNKSTVKLLMNFVNKNSNSLKANIDGNSLTIDTDNDQYGLNITPYINSMNSYIKLSPLSNVAISSLIISID